MQGWKTGEGWKGGVKAGKGGEGQFEKHVVPWQGCFRRQPCWLPTLAILLQNVLVSVTNSNLEYRIYHYRLH